MTRILIVEDEELLRKLYTELLEMKGYKVDAMRGGREALDYLNDNKPQMILLDVNMPEIDGPEFLKIMKENEDFRKIPVVVITGLVQLEKITECLNLGAVGYIEKASSPVEIIGKIEMIVGAFVESPQSKSTFRNPLIAVGK